MNVATDPFTTRETARTCAHVGKPIALRKLDTTAARMQRRLARVIDPVPITQGGAQIFLGLDAPRRVAANTPWLHVAIDGHSAALQLPWGVARKLAGVPVEGISHDDAALLIEAGVAQWLDEVEAALGISVRFLAIGIDLDSFNLAPLEVATTLNIKGRNASGNFVEMRLSARLSSCAAAAIGDSLKPRRHPRNDLPGLILRCYLEREAVLLTCAELADLEPGDAITLDSDRQHETFVLENQFQASVGRSKTGELRLSGPFQSLTLNEETPTMSETADAEIDATPADLDEIELRLTFRAGQTAMSLKAIRELGPGSVVEMTEPADGTVEIVVNGRVVGSGEMIDVAGHRAIQIRRLFTGP